MTLWVLEVQGRLELRTKPRILATVAGRVALSLTNMGNDEKE